MDLPQTTCFIQYASCCMHAHAFRGYLRQVLAAVLHESGLEGCIISSGASNEVHPANCLQAGLVHALTLQFGPPQ